MRKEKEGRRVKIIYEIDTTSEEAVYHKVIYGQANEMYAALSEIKEAIRNKLKYCELKDDVFKAWEDIEKVFYSALNDNNVRTDV